MLTFFSNAISSKLASLLQPWLIGDPRLDLHLGFLRSDLRTEGLVLDASALDRFLPDSIRMSVHSVEIRDVSLRFSLWGGPALRLEVCGLDVILTARGADGCLRGSLGIKELRAKERRKMLALLDPEGISLNETLQKILAVKFSRNRLMTTMVNVGLRHCQLQVCDAHLKLQFPHMDESLECFWMVKKLHLESVFVDSGCLLKGLFCAFFTAQEESSFVLNVSDLEIGLKREDHVNAIAVSKDLLICFRLKNLLLSNLDTHIPRVNFAFSPFDVPVLLVVLNMLSSKVVMRIRSGRELWKIASLGIGCLSRNYGSSFYILARTVVSWVRYAHAYESLLLSIGYSDKKAFEEAMSRIAQNEKFLNCLKHQWKAVSDIEDELPVEAVARARHSARQRAGSQLRYCTTDLTSTGTDLTSVGSTSFWWKLLEPLSYIWKVICVILYSFRCIFFLMMSIFVRDSKDGPSFMSDTDDSYFKWQIGLHLGELSVKFIPVSSVSRPIEENLASGIKHSDLKLNSFYITMSTLWLVYVEDLSVQSLSLACGSFRIQSNSTVQHTSGSLQLEMDNDCKSILWSEPAPCLQKANNECIEFLSCYWRILESYLGEMWSDWERKNKRFKQIASQDSELPFLLCEVKSFLMDPYLNTPACGLCKWNFTSGKLNLVLEYLSIMSIYLLLRQLLDIYHLTVKSKGPGSLSHSSTIFKEHIQMRENWFEFYASRLKIGMLRLVPAINMHVGLYVIAPNVTVSMPEEVFPGVNLTAHGVDQCSITFDLGKILFVVCPTSDDNSTTFIGKPEWHESGANYCIMGPQSIDGQSLGSNGTSLSQGCLAISSCLSLVCSGMSIYLETSKVKQPSQIFGPMSITMRSSFCRESWGSLTGTRSASSMTLSGVVTGATILCFLDELYLLFQVLQGLSVLSDAYADLDSTNIFYFRRFIQKYMVSANSDHKEINDEFGFSFILNGTKLSIEASLDFDVVNIILCNSKRKHVMQNHEKANYGSSRSTTTTWQQILAKYGKRTAGMLDVPDFGGVMSIQKSHLQIFLKEELVKVHFDISGIQSAIIKCQDQIGKCTDGSEIRNLLHRSSNPPYEFSLSHCTFKISSSSLGDSLSSSNALIEADSNTPMVPRPNAVEDSSLIISSDGSEVRSFGSSEQLEQGLLLSENFQESTSCWFLLINIGAFLFVEHSVRDVLVEAHQGNKFVSSLSIGGKFSLFCEIQGGPFVLETKSLATFIHFFSAYPQCIMNILSSMLSREQSERVTSVMVVGNGLVSPSNDLNGEYIQDTVSFQSSEVCDSTLESKWIFDELLVTIRMSDITLVLAVSDGSGSAWELILEVDLNLRLDLTDVRRGFWFDLSRLAIFSQNLQKYSLQQTATEASPVPHFSSYLANGASSSTGATEPYLPIQVEERKNWALVADSAIPAKRSVDNDVSESHVSYHRCDILKHVVASIRVEKAVHKFYVSPWLKNDWIGSGSMSGFELTITITEIEMIVALLAPLSGVYVGNGRNDLKQKCESSNRPESDSSVCTIADGAVVAIEDLHQHMYLAVEPVEDGYRLIGVLHYSLVGDRALFRVKYHRQWRWQSPTSWFSLISLHAKNDAGEPLRLNFCPGSGFVAISSTDERGWALWKMLPYKPESSGGDDDLECYTQLNKKAFYLVNKKSDCAVALVDGFPEFVKKPGNPFKIKVFNGVSLKEGSMNQSVRNTCADDACETEENGSSLKTCEARSSLLVTTPFVNITIGKVTLTILNEVPDANEKFPLIRGVIDNFQFVIQTVFPKIRLICSMTAGIYFLDACGNVWREIVSPFEVRMFYCATYMLQSENFSQEVPVRFYCRIGRMDLSLTELSLDMLLFLAGKMNLAGPYAIKSKMIIANCCKVENCSGLTLLCRFDDNHVVKVGGKQSASVFLRWGALVDQLSENVGLVSLQLIALGTFATSPIDISLLNARAVALRTRVVSLQDSKTFPGPYVVIDISRKFEDGLSLKISPLLRIHNESGFSMDLRFRRPLEEVDYASVTLLNGDAIDDCMAVFDAINLSGGLKKALMSLSLGNFLLSFRPNVSDNLEKPGKPVSVEWSEEMSGGKAVRLSGIFDKLNYRFKQAFGIGSVKLSFSTVCCSLMVGGSHVTNLHFLIKIIKRDVPVMRPLNMGNASETGSSPIAIQEQSEISILPTVHVSNLLDSDIIVMLTESHPDLYKLNDYDLTGKQAAIPCGSNAYFYANPSIIYFTVTLTAFDTKCKPVNSGDWIKKMQKQKDDIHYLDIELDFDSGRQFATLRLSCGERGMLEASVFTSYMLQNDTHLSLLFAPKQKLLSREELNKYGLRLPPELGCVLPPKTSRSWFLKSNKLCLKCLEEDSSEALFNLDALSGLTELHLVVQDEAGVEYLENFGVLLKPYLSNAVVSSQIVSVAPRYVIYNESGLGIIVRQCFLEDDSYGTHAIDSQQKMPLRIRNSVHKRKEIRFIDSMLNKHRNPNVESLVFIQFSLKETGWSWSGGICIASLGRFFLKFKRPSSAPVCLSDSNTESKNKFVQYAVAHVVEEGSTLVLHFHMPPKVNMPYRIVNHLQDASITFYQKEYLEPEIVEPGDSIDYAWDDLNLPHKLVVQVTGMHLSRDINIDKISGWKPLLKTRQTRGLPLHAFWDKPSGDRRKRSDESNRTEMLKVGYEVYADGSTRILRICELKDENKEDKILRPCLKIQFRISQFAVHVLENGVQTVDRNETPIYSTIVVATMGNVTLDSLFTYQHKFNAIKIQTFNVDAKWQGAPFAALLRRNRLEYDDMESILNIVFILHPSESKVSQVKRFLIVLQPINLNIDEDTLMKLVPFWRTSLSDSSQQSRQFYFRHFEIHPIKIVASFLPGSPNSSYSSAQEALRSLLHGVIKVPDVKNLVVELNGVLLSHALVTTRELLVKCAQHYSWYAIRAVYIAKGSSMLPPAFASIFDDTASSSLDVFFDPSSGINLPGLTLGTFQFINKCINTKGLSGTKRYFGDLGKTMKTAGSNVLFAAVTEISDSVLKGAETSGFNGMMIGFHQGILKLAMEPSLLGTAVMEGGPNRKIKLDRSPGVDELYVEGYLQAMLDVMYKQEYLRVRLSGDEVILKNLPPSSSLINEITNSVKSFLMSEALLKGDPSVSSTSLRHLHRESEWRIGPTLLTLCEHLFVSFSIRMLRKQATKFVAGIKWKGKSVMEGPENEIIRSSSQDKQVKSNLKWGVGRFILSGLVAYVDGRLCRCIPNPIARRIVSGFLLSFLDKDTNH